MTQTAGSKATVVPNEPFRIYEHFLEAGLTDGLPVLPPTREAVDEILSWSILDGNEILGAIPPSGRRATVESVAVNAVMAGLPPRCFPIVLTALTAMLEPRFNLMGMQATTHPAAPLVIVSGSIGVEAGVHSGPGVFGPTFRANATIGRAIRLVLLNVGNAKPGVLDHAVLGHPGKFTYCIGENEPASPWEPLRQDRGFEFDDTCVTVVPAEGPHNINDHFSNTAESILMTVVGSMTQIGANDWWYPNPEPLLVFGPEHAGLIGAENLGRRDVQQYVFEHAKIPLARFALANQLGRFRESWPDLYGDVDANVALVPLLGKPEDLIVLVSGGPGKHSVHIPTAGNFFSVTKRIVRKDGAPARSLAELRR